MENYKINLAVLLLIILTWFSSCSINNKVMIEVGEKLSHEIKYETDTYRMTSSGSMEPMYKVALNDVDFVFCKNQSDVITYIETKDKDFTTKEGLKVGMSYEDAKSKVLQKAKLEKGWAYVLPLDEGWHAAFDLSENDLQKMSSDSTIKWFYKRK